MIGCTSCGKWLHEECVIADVKQRVLERGGPPSVAAETQESEPVIDEPVVEVPVVEEPVVEEPVVEEPVVEEPVIVAKDTPKRKSGKGKSLFQSAINSYIDGQELKESNGEVEKDKKDTAETAKETAADKVDKVETEEVEKPADATITAPNGKSAKKTKAELKVEQADLDNIKTTIVNDTTTKVHVRDLRAVNGLENNTQARKRDPENDVVVEEDDELTAEVPEWDEEVRCLCCGVLIE